MASAGGRKEDMVRRGRNGGGRGPLSGKLRQRIMSVEKSSSASIEEVVDYLRSSYRDYSHQKLLPFTSQVQKILHLLNPNLRPAEEEIMPPRKKQKRDSSDEAKHITNRQRNKQDGDGELSTLASTSGSDDSYSSSDAIYDEKTDLMRVMLRKTYYEQANSTPKSKKIEYEVIHDNNDEKGKKIDMLKEGKQRWDLTKLAEGGGGAGGRNGHSDGNGGPMFKDLGGMDAVLEELKMEVIVPLYHPQLTRHLELGPYQEYSSTGHLDVGKQS